MAVKKSFDVIVVGGGLVGLLQSILLAQNNISVLCIDKQDEKSVNKNPFYKRTTAISYGSQQLLKFTDLWDQLAPYSCPIQKIEVLDGQSPTLLKFDLDDNKEAKKANGFGWVIENQHIQDVLIKALKKLKYATYISGIGAENIHVDGDQIHLKTSNQQSYSAKLLIGADGRQSFVRRSADIKTESFSYNQNAVISIIEHENDHQNIAVEHFKSSGPFAILPMTDGPKGQKRSSIVWTEESETQNSILSWSDKTYLTALRQKFPERYGDIINTTERFSYPLGFIHAQSYIADRIALIGDAAHGIHPVAGQGLNLGLRDVASLSELIIEARINNTDIGDKNLLTNYQQLRKSDNSYMAFLTDGLNRLFAHKSKTMRLGRKFGLKLFSHLKPAKNHLIAQTMGTSGKIPNLMKNRKIN